MINIKPLIELKSNKHNLENKNIKTILDFNMYKEKKESLQDKISKELSENTKSHVKKALNSKPSKLATNCINDFKDYLKLFRNNEDIKKNEVLKYNNSLLKLNKIKNKDYLAPFLDIINQYIKKNYCFSIEELLSNVFEKDALTMINNEIIIHYGMGREEEKCNNDYAYLTKLVNIIHKNKKKNKITSNFKNNKYNINNNNNNCKALNLINNNCNKLFKTSNKNNNNNNSNSVKTLKNYSSNNLTAQNYSENLIQNKELLNMNNNKLKLNKNLKSEMLDNIVNSTSALLNKNFNDIDLLQSKSNLLNNKQSYNLNTICYDDIQKKNKILEKENNQLKTYYSEFSKYFGKKDDSLFYKGFNNNNIINTIDNTFSTINNNNNNNIIVINNNISKRNNDTASMKILTKSFYKNYLNNNLKSPLRAKKTNENYKDIKNKLSLCSKDNLSNSKYKHSTFEFKIPYNFAKYKSSYKKVSNDSNIDSNKQTAIHTKYNSNNYSSCFTSKLNIQNDSKRNLLTEHKTNENFNKNYKHKKMSLLTNICETKKVDNCYFNNKLNIENNPKKKLSSFITNKKNIIFNNFKNNYNYNYIHSTSSNIGKLKNFKKDIKINAYNRNFLKSITKVSFKNNKKFDNNMNIINQLNECEIINEEKGASINIKLNNSSLIKNSISTRKSNGLNDLNTISSNKNDILSPKNIKKIDNNNNISCRHSKTSVKSNSKYKKLNNNFKLKLSNLNSSKSLMSNKISSNQNIKKNNNIKNTSNYFFKVKTINNKNNKCNTIANEFNNSYKTSVKILNSRNASKDFDNLKINTKVSTNKNLKSTVNKNSIKYLLKRASYNSFISKNKVVNKEIKLNEITDKIMKEGIGDNNLINEINNYFKIYKNPKEKPDLYENK